ncbi:MAG TPA: hypothetical protein DC042_18005 [Bacteroidales bacterium]|nr:hypothetical protein [Bacteroidales bacterium]
MPTVLRIGAYRFHFYSDEFNEPPHIHVETADGKISRIPCTLNTHK